MILTYVYLNSTNISVKAMQVIMVIISYIVWANVFNDKYCILKVSRIFSFKMRKAKDYKLVYTLHRGIDDYDLSPVFRICKNKGVTMSSGVTQKRIDDILDKINKSGIKSLNLSEINDLKSLK